MTSFLFSRMLSWENARAVCLGFGGDLVSINNEKERNFLYLDLNIASWIGLNDRLNEGQFVWSDGTPFSSSVYSNWPWLDGEPNNSGNQDCVEIKSGGWDDQHCSEERFYICERSKGELIFLCA